MKFKVTMKNPDCVWDALQDAAEESVALTGAKGLDEEEREALIESKRGKLSKLCERWFEYGEYLTVEVDTEAKTCVVVPC